MTLAEQLKQTNAYKEAQSELQKQQNKLRIVLAEKFEKNPKSSMVWYFGKMGHNANYGMEQDVFARFVRSEGFRVEELCNGYGVQYVRVTLE